MSRTPAPPAPRSPRAFGRLPRLAALALAPLLLGGCLEVEQHPVWRDGHYDNKRDNMHHQVHFHNDRLAWNAALTDRNHLQNEYNRTGVPPRRRDEDPDAAGPAPTTRPAAAAQQANRPGAPQGARPAGNPGDPR